MKTKRIRAIKRLTLLVLKGFLFYPTLSFALESDQFSLPPEPLMDIREVISEKVWTEIESAVAQTNQSLADHRACLTQDPRLWGQRGLGSQPNRETQKSDGSDNSSRDLGDLFCSYHRKILKDSTPGQIRFDPPIALSTIIQWHKEDILGLSSRLEIARAIMKNLGEGLIFTHIDRFVHGLENNLKHESRPIKYKPPREKSIYSMNDLIYFTSAESINFNGVYFGADKLAHFFSEGFTYFEKVLDLEKNGIDKPKAIQEAVAWGQKTERTYLGLGVSAVYSNGDLAANFSGYQFYESLTQGIELGSIRRPPLLRLVSNQWEINPEFPRYEILDGLITDHLNEALNPSIYVGATRHSVLNGLREFACQQWKEQDDQKRLKYPIAELERVSQSLRHWSGMDYGFEEDPLGFLSIQTTCGYGR